MSRQFCLHNRHLLIPSPIILQAGHSGRHATPFLSCLYSARHVGHHSVTSRHVSRRSRVTAAWWSLRSIDSNTRSNNSLIYDLSPFYRSKRNIFQNTSMPLPYSMTSRALISQSTCSNRSNCLGDRHVIDNVNWKSTNSSRRAVIQLTLYSKMKDPPCELNVMRSRYPFSFERVGPLH